MTAETLTDPSGTTVTESFADRIDATTAETLRAIGGTKWSDPEVAIGAFVAEMDFGIAPAITDALHRAVDEGSFGYFPARIAEDLRVATADRLRSRHGWTVRPDQVFPVPDVIEALKVTIEQFSPAGSKVIVPTPSYMPFLFVPPMLGREVIQVPMREGDDGAARFDLEAIQRAFDDGGNCFVLCNPYNPLGRVFDRDELIALSAVIQRNGGRVFSDEIWAPLVFPDAELVSYATIDETTASHTITATSASKAFNLPGLKCAQLIVSNEADREKLAEQAMWLGHGASNLGMIANTAAYTEGQPWLDEVLEYLRGNRDEFIALVAQHLPGVRVRAPQGTYVGWLDFRGTGIEKPGEFFRERAGVGVTDGSACGLAGEGHARFIFALPRPLLREALQRMGDAMRHRAV